MPSSRPYSRGVCSNCGTFLTFDEIQKHQTTKTRKLASVDRSRKGVDSDEQVQSRLIRRNLPLARGNGLSH